MSRILRSGAFCRVAGCLLALAGAGTLPAQFNSEISGLVMDDTGGIVAEAKVRLANAATGVARELTTQADGFYRALSLSPGTYDIQVEKTGFQVVQRKGVVVGITESVRVDVTLKVGTVSERITVTEQAAQIETEQGRISGRIDRLQLDDLPLNGRNLFDLLALQPGITGKGLTGIGSGTDTFSGELKMEAYASGLRSEANSYTMDDTNVNSLSRGGATNLTPNADSVEEVRVVSNNFSAVDGRNGGAQIQVLSKAGTNEFHGGASYYFHNNTLASRGIFETSLPVFRKNLFGYTLGGPVFKNRTFFFTSYQGLRSSGARAANYVVETPEFRDFVLRTRPNSIAARLLGDFRPAADPTFNFRDLGSPRAGVNVSGPADGIMDVGSVTYVPLTVREGTQFNGRIDHDLRPGKDRLYGNFYWTAANWVNGGIREAFNRPTDEHTFFASVNYTHIFSPNKLNELRGGIMRDVGKPQTPKRLEVPGVNIPGSAGYGITYFPAAWFQTNFHYKDIFSWVRASHSLKLGGEVRRARQNTWNTNYYVPQYGFANILDFADDEPLTMLREVDPRTGEPATTVVGLRVTEWALFVQDDWKVTRNFTLNIGMRYENFGTPTEVNGLLRNFLFGAGGNYGERLGSGRVDMVEQLFPVDHNNFAPRIGFAWNPEGKGRTAIRGGYGLAYDRPFTYFLFFKDLPPLRAQANLGALLGTSFTYSMGDPSKLHLGFPVDPSLRLGLDERNGIRGVRVALNTVDPELTTAYIQNWFFGVQQVLPGGVIADVNYLGSTGRHLYIVSNENRYRGDMLDGRFSGFNPSFAAINMQQSNSNSVYHGASISLRRPFANGFTLQGAYTIGKAIDDSDTLTSNTNYQNAANRALDRGLAGFDVPQKLSLVGVWDLPFLRNRTGMAARLFGGWKLSGFGIFQSGTPLTITTSAAWPRGDYNGDNAGGDRPNAPAEGVLRSGLNRSEFLAGIFKVADFPIPAQGTDGTMGRNLFRGPGFAQVDLSLSKRFGITERLSSQLRLDALNAFNRVNLNNPVVDLNNINFGRSMGNQTPRLYQLGLRFDF